MKTDPTERAIKQIQLLNKAVSEAKDTSMYSIAHYLLKEFKKQGKAKQTPAVYLSEMQNDIDGLIDDLIDAVWTQQDFINHDVEVEGEHRQQ